jgi:uncharacterized membrane protein YvlD (DUF360 family)
MFIEILLSITLKPILQITMPITFIKWDAKNLVVNSRMKDFVTVAKNVTSSQNKK